jgi:NADPH2:quinone reductase
VSRTTSRAYVLEEFGAPEVMRLGERPAPLPGPGEALVGVEVAGVNFADTMIRRGEYLRDQSLSLTPGSEVVGRVIEAGAGVEIATGTRVAGWVEAGGAYADHVLVPVDHLYAVPDTLPAGVIAAVFLQGTTAEYALHRYGRLRPGEVVLIHAAAGGVGGLAVQLAKLAGARVIATASSHAKLEVAREQGADVLIDSSDEETLAERLSRATEGRGCDVIIDGVGGSLFDSSLSSLAFGGRYVIFGAASQQPSILDARRLMVRGQSVCGFILARVIESDPAEPSRALDALCALVHDSQLFPRYEVLTLEQAPEAHRRIEARTVSGKLLLAGAYADGELAWTSS